MSYFIVELRSRVSYSEAVVCQVFVHCFLGLVCQGYESLAAVASAKTCKPRGLPPTTAWRIDFL